MTPIQWAGAAAVLVGLILLVFERFGRTIEEQVASVKGWKIEASGSVALVLVVVGILGLWLGDNKEPDRTPASSTTTTTTTSTLPPTTIVSPTTTTLPALEYQPPNPILEVWTDYNEEVCDDYALYWYDDPNADYYLIQVAAMDDFDDIRIEEWQFESWPPLCEWEIQDWSPNRYARYWLWISAVQGDIQTTPYFVEYYATP